VVVKEKRKKKRKKKSESFVDFDQEALAKTRHDVDCGLICEGQ
jgi:hypothetical protein